MTNRILDGIIAKLNEISNCPVYTKQEEQGVEEPCFFVFLVNSEEDEKTMGRYFQRNLFHVVYIPTPEEAVSGYYMPYEELYSIKCLLDDSLRYIQLASESILRGTDLNGKIQNNQLDYYVHYDLYVTKEQVKNPVMENLETTVSKRG